MLVSTRLSFITQPQALFESTRNHFLNAASEVSAHYIIDKNGDIYQMVKDADKAWHAA
ncbi:MAG: N-acetylmuramoyl-L-alanine amidase, partial [Leptolyngbyaceae cyanobacterium CRU_2_3]|nr:N-acetylmuramoyl-L-alanine amidase [Leptolyngbyaceae cyanobacterium CRU_2_3]